MDQIDPIVFVKNESKRNIIVTFDTLSDENLFYGTKYSIDSNSSESINGVGPDIEKIKKITFYTFDRDSVYKYIKLNIVPEIVKKSFLKRYDIDIENFKKNDTLIYK
jgi:hypothetical protein